MRILLVSQYFWPESFRINDVVSLLQDEGCEVTVLTGQPNYPAGTLFPGYRAFGMGRDQSSSYRIYRVPLVPRGRASAIGLLLNYVSFVFFASLLGPWLLRRQRFDVIFVYGLSPILQALPAILLKWIKRRPLVIWVQDLWPESLEVTGYVKNIALLRFVGAITAWIYRRADLVLGQSHAFVRTLAPMANPVPVEFFPTPGDLDYPADRSSIMSLPQGFTVVFAGNLGTAQALPTVIEAATLLRAREDIQFVFLGDGSLKQWLADEAMQRQLVNIHLLGRFPPSDMPALLAQASVLLASLNKSDILAQTIPAKISTYLKVGRPIVASIDGEGGEVVTEAGAGVACPAEDVQALVDAILHLRSLPEAQREAMGAAGRRYFEATFEPRVLTHRLLDLLKRVVDRA